jgi:hypothetical protein
MHEIHGLLAVAENNRRLPSRNSLHPADQDLGIASMQVHPFAVDVEIAKRHVVELVHVVEGAQQSFVEGLGGAV